LVTGHLSEGSFVRNRVVQIPKFGTKPKANSNPNPIYAYTFQTNDPSDKCTVPIKYTKNATGILLTFPFPGFPAVILD